MDMKRNNGNDMSDDVGGGGVFFNISSNENGGNTDEMQMSAMMNLLLFQSQPNQFVNSKQNENFTLNQRKRLFNQIDDITPLPFNVDEDDGRNGCNLRGILEESDPFEDFLPTSDSGITSIPPLFDQSHSNIMPFTSSTSHMVNTQHNKPPMAPKFEPSSISSWSIPFCLPNNNNAFEPAPITFDSFTQSTPSPISLIQQDMKAPIRQNKMSPPRRKNQIGDKVKQQSFKSFVVKKWTEEEDELLRKAVEVNVSKNWKTIAKSVPGRNEQQCIQRWKNVLACNFKKGAWSPEEDQILWNLIESHKGQDDEAWDKEAAKILNRTPKQCRERWENAMNPNLCNKEFSKEEDDAILSLHDKLGNQWKKIAAFLNGRTGNRVKSRFQSLQKKTKTYHEGGHLVDSTMTI